MHDDFTNKFTFVYKDSKNTLTPLALREVSEDQLKMRKKRKAKRKEKEREKRKEKGKRGWKREREKRIKFVYKRKRSENGYATEKANTLTFE